MMKYVKIILDDKLGAGLDYQFNHLYHAAKKIGLNAELMEVKE